MTETDVRVIHGRAPMQYRVARDLPGKPVKYRSKCKCGWLSPECGTTDAARAFQGDHLTEFKWKR